MSALQEINKTAIVTEGKTTYMIKGLGYVVIGSKSEYLLSRMGDLIIEHTKEHRCKGCQYSWNHMKPRKEEKDFHCYMFRDKPESCKQNS